MKLIIDENPELYVVRDDGQTMSVVWLDDEDAIRVSKLYGLQVRVSSLYLTQGSDQVSIHTITVSGDND